MISFEPLDGAALDAWRAAISGRLVERRVAAGLPRALVTSEVESLVRARWDERPATDPSYLLMVLAHGEPTGTAWVGGNSGQPLVLFDLDVPDAHLAAALEALLGHLGSPLEVPVLDGDLARSAAVEALHGTLVATHMLLDLATPMGKPARVRLVPFTEDDLAAYTATSIGTYAGEIFATGGFESREQAMEQATSQYAELLPDGLASAGQHLWAAYDGSERVGRLWIFVEGDWSFIYDIEMLPEARGRGYGTEVLALGATAAKELGAAHLGLNVFGHNEAARRLYERSGFATTRRFFRLDG